MTDRDKPETPPAGGPSTFTVGWPDCMPARHTCVARVTQVILVGWLPTGTP